MTKITDYADPSTTVMLQAFNWESHQAGKGNWYGIVESKVDMLKDTRFRMETKFGQTKSDWNRNGLETQKTTSNQAIKQTDPQRFS